MSDEQLAKHEPRAVCACQLSEPCMPSCSCANTVMSGGCLRCATYGSAEQQLSAAAAIAARNGAGEDRHVEAVIDKLRSRSKAGQQVLLTNPSPTLAERYRARESELAEVAIHALGEEARAAGEDLSMGFRVSQPRMKKALAAVVDALAKL